MPTYLLTGQTKEDCHNQMNFHMLLDCGRRNLYKFLFLALIVLAIFPVSNSFAQQDQTIILTTNKISYLPGDVVVVNGTVTGQPGQLVAIQVKDSSGNLILIRTIESDQNGNFSLQFKIPSTAISGNFNIIASARINGFIITQTKIMSATVPEFGSLAVPILLLCTASLILFYRTSIRK